MPLPASLVRIRVHNLGDTLPDGRKASGKEPRDRAWQRQTESAPVEPGNWGYLPGPSGLGVLDVEPAGLALFQRPAGVLTIDTPSSGYHLPAELPLLEAILGPLRKKLKLGNKAELHTWGSQVLGPGSRAWSDKAGREGTYVLQDGPLWVPTAEMLAPFAELLAKGARKQGGVPVAPTGVGWANTAIKAELDALAATPEGQRNDALNLRGFRIGQIVGAGLLDQASAVEMFIAAAMQAGLSEREARATATRAIEAGTHHPRGPRELPTIELVEHAVEVAPLAPAVIPDTLGHVTRTVLVPGTYKDAADQYHEQSNSAFAEQTLAALPAGLFYRRDLVPGQVHGARFIPASETTFRRLCDEPHVRLAKWIRVKDEEGPHQAQVTERCTAPLAGLVENAAAHALPEIKLLTGYPIALLGGGISPPGYHVASGTYYSGEHIPPESSHERIRATLDDLLVDFPFEDEQSRHNFIGLLLTPLLRLLVGRAPIHLVTSPQPGTGKSRLVEEILGGIYLGEELAASMLPESVEERVKWLVALLLSGECLLHLDNLSDQLDSANLASLVTSRRQAGRILGASTFARLENQLSIAATGNNTQLSSELARRTVVVRLLWRGKGRPDERTEFAHPDPLAYVLERRREVLGCLQGAYLSWVEAGSAPGTRPMGSFERWAAVLGGVLAHLGYGEHLSNRPRWREGTDSEEAELAALVEAWATRHGTEAVTASELIATSLGSLEALMERPTPVRVGRLLARLVDRTIAGRTVRVGWSASRQRAYRIEGSRDDRGIENTSLEDITLFNP